VLQCDVNILNPDASYVWHISGNRDEEVFPDRNRFDVSRTPAPQGGQVAFGGGGPHFCLGAHLARAEMKVTFGALLPHLLGSELLAPPRRLRSNLISRVREMPVRLGPRRAQIPPARPTPHR
jgi:cholest-4-en-3-one 26-monooxygenase